MQVKANGIRLVFDEEKGAEIVLSLAKANTQEIKKDLAKLKQGLAKGKTLAVEIKEHKERRSLDANAYFHLLVNKMAKALNLSEDDVKAKMVLAYGTIAKDEQGETVGVKVPKGIKIQNFYPYARWFDTRKENGKDFDCYIFYKRTHTMDKSEMARLIDGVVFEAQQLGIETKTPDEIAQMMSLMEDK